MPPFVIFGDISLQEMAYYLPNNDAQFLNINGVGQQKLTKFGPIFITAIQEFTTENNLQPQGKTGNTGNVVVAPKVINYNPTRYQATKTGIAHKLSITQIADQQGIKPSTITTHLEKMLAGGEELDLEYLKASIADFEFIQLAFKQIGTEMLRPVFDHLKEKYSYEDLKMVRLLMGNAQA